MSYFKNFPFVLDYSIQGRMFEGQDMTRRTGFDKKDKDNENIFQYYYVKNGESAHVIADRAYDDPQLYWIILMFNDIIDPIAQWPMSSQTFNRYVERKYGKNNIYKTHHYESADDGSVVDRDHPDYDRITITNYEYEERLNEARAKIKVPYPQYARDLVKQHQDKIK